MGFSSSDSIDDLRVFSGKMFMDWKSPLASMASNYKQ
jgi:hypothetical protein